MYEVKASVAKGHSANATPAWLQAFLVYLSFSSITFLRGSSKRKPARDLPKQKVASVVALILNGHAAIRLT